MVEVKLKKNGRSINVEKALRILKKKMDKEGIMDDMKEHRFFVPDSDKKREKAKKKERACKNNGDK